MIENIDFIADTEFEILKKVSNFGKFSIKHFLIKDDCLRVEEYISPKDDHVEECKSIHQNPNHGGLGVGGISHHCVVNEIPPKCMNRPEVIEKSVIDSTTETGRHKIVKIREVENSHHHGKSKPNKQIMIATTTQTSTQTEPPHHHHHRDLTTTAAAATAAAATAAAIQGGLRESHSSTKHIETAHNINGLPPAPHHPSHHFAPGMFNQFA